MRSRQVTEWTVLLAAVVFSVLNSGCATHSHTAGRLITQVQAGQVDVALQQYAPKHTGRDRQLSLVECGRINLLDGCIEDAKADFAAAIKEVADLEGGAVIRLRDVGSTLASSTLTDDTVREYHLAGYEIVMLFLNQAMAHLFCGNSEAAMVELRRAAYAQEQIAERLEEEVAEARRQIEEENHQASFEKVRNSFAEMAPVLGRVKNSYQNAYVWYLLGLFYETAGDPSNAYISYKKAWELVPGNAYLKQDLLRLSASENPDEHEEFLDSFGPPKEQVEGTADVFVIYEEGLVPRREQIKIPLPIAGTLQTLTFPTYTHGPYFPQILQVEAAGQDLGTLQPVCYLQSLAYRDLQEKMPGTVIRNVTRAVTRGVAQRAMRESDNTAVKMVGLFSQIGAAIIDRADTRAWYTLPMVVQVLHSPLPAGVETVRIESMTSGGRVDIPVHSTPGDRIIVWVADIEGWAGSGMVKLNTIDTDTTAEFAKRGSLMPTNAFSTADAWTRIGGLPTASYSVELDARPPSEVAAPTNAPAATPDNADEVAAKGGDGAAPEAQPTHRGEPREAKPRHGRAAADAATGNRPRVTSFEDVQQQRGTDTPETGKGDDDEAVTPEGGASADGPAKRKAPINIF